MQRCFAIYTNDGGAASKRAAVGNRRSLRCVTGRSAAGGIERQEEEHRAIEAARDAISAPPCTHAGATKRLVHVLLNLVVLFNLA